MADIDRVIDAWADQITRIIASGTVGDYTWVGLLTQFLREADIARLDDQPDDGGHFPDMDDPTKQAHADLDRDPYRWEL